GGGGSKLSAGSGAPACVDAGLAQTSHARSTAARACWRSLAAAGGMARRPLPLTVTCSTPREPLEPRRVGRRAAQRLRAELHVVGAAELLLREIHREDLFELLAVPPEAAQELLVVRTDLVPVRQQRRGDVDARSEEHTSELQSRFDLVCRLLLEKKKIKKKKTN